MGQNHGDSGSRSILPNNIGERNSRCFFLSKLGCKFRQEFFSLISWYTEYRS